MVLTSDTDKAIDVRGLQKAYRTGFLRRRREALRGLTLAVPRGRVFALLGPNGSGKTTLLKILLGLVRPNSGTFRILGSVPGVRTRGRVGFVPDRPHHHGFLTGRETLSFYADVLGVAKSVKPERIEKVLSLVGMQACGDLRMRFFSKGMLQRVALAQAMLNEPELLILDEPIGALDPHGVEIMRRIVRDMREAGKTVLFSSHLLSYAQEMADAYAILENGCLVQQGVVGETSLTDLYLRSVTGNR